nr:immunoglobulin heavy chain junction region [Macaca mulatta]
CAANYPIEYFAFW